MISVVLSGGAIRGANQAGGLLRLHELKIPVETVVGSSVGALNGALFAQGDASKLADVWLNEIRTSKDIYKEWFPWFTKKPWSYMNSITGYFRGGLYNTLPLATLINKYVDGMKLCYSNIKYACCVVDPHGEYDPDGKNDPRKIFIENKNTNYDRIKDYVLASASVPIVFPPVKRDGRHLVDGGLLEPVPVKYAIENSKSENKIIIMLASRIHTLKQEIGQNMISTVIATVNTLINKTFADDIDKGLLIYGWDAGRFRIFKTKNYFVDSFDVDHDKIRRSFDDGYKLMGEICASL